MPSVPLDEQQVLDATIGQRVLEEMYEDDSSAALTVQLSHGGVQVTLTSSMQSAIMPSDDLLEAVGQLVNTHERDSTGLSGAVYRYEKQPTGRWTMRGDFQYTS